MEKTYFEKYNIKKEGIEMGKRILFSPIGGTDPITGFHDGSMLHICRYYKPDVVYLFMTHEILEYHKKDNRYMYALKRLEAYLGISFEAHVIERNDLIDVQQYDVFYRIFKEKLDEIECQMKEDDELLLNMSSGTPAMKSALFVLATFAEYRYKPIQVSTPIKRMNSEHGEYDSENNWIQNKDNIENAPNRCEEVKSLNLVRMIQIENIKKHIMAYDYVAALSIANEIKDSIPEEVLVWLQIMDARVKLNHQKIDELTEGKSYDVYPIKIENKRTMFEYALVLQRELEKQEYANFIRGITPLVMDLLEEVLNNKCKIKLDDYCDMENGKRKWNIEKLKEAGLKAQLDKAYRNAPGNSERFSGKIVYSNHIAKLIECRCADKRVSEAMREITWVEQRVRNIAAHEVVSVTEEWIKKRTEEVIGEDLEQIDENNPKEVQVRHGKSAKEIFDLLKSLVEMAGINATEEDWRSYDKVNERIIEYLK